MQDSRRKCKQEDGLRNASLVVHSSYGSIWLSVNVHLNVYTVVYADIKSLIGQCHPEGHPKGLLLPLLAGHSRFVQTLKGSVDHLPIPFHRQHHRVEGQVDVVAHTSRDPLGVAGERLVVVAEDALSEVLLHRQAHRGVVAPATGTHQRVELVRRRPLE